MLILKETKRSEFKKPFGKLYPSVKSLKKKLNDYKLYNLIISVGDVTTLNLQIEGIEPDLCIIDNKIERQESEFETRQINYNVQLSAENAPGTITKELWDNIEKAFNLIETYHYKILIVVEGEEDLAVIPCVMMAPSNSVVLYGQPGEGVVLCEVDKIKDEAIKLLKKFEEA